MDRDVGFEEFVVQRTPFSVSLPRRPSLHSSTLILDDFVVNAAAIYASMVQESQKNSISDTLNQDLRRSPDIFLGLFQDNQQYQRVLNAESKDAQHMLDTMLDLLDSDRIEEQFKAVLDVVILRLARTSGLYPMRLVFHHVLHQNETLPIGTIDPIIQGTFDGKLMSIKISGIRIESSPEIVSRHLLLLTRLRHKNVFPLSKICVLHHYDVSGLYDCGLGLAYPLSQNGNIVDFLLNNPGDNRRSFIADVAAGMAYLHDNGIVHGRIHGQNILVADTLPLRACLTDCGLASVISVHVGPSHVYNSSAIGMRAIQFLAPEDHYHTISRTEASDIYAFSTASYEILTGHLPLEHELVRCSPRRPVEQIYHDRGLSAFMWQLMMDSWQADPQRRPSARRILETLVMEKVTTMLSAILNDVTHYKQLLSCSQIDSQEVLDTFQLLLDTENFQDRALLIAAMRRLSERTEKFPARFFLEAPAPAAEDDPVATGSFGEIYQVNFQGEQTCFKVIRINEQSDVEHITKVYAREAIIWAQLSHPNILPFFGLSKFQSRLSFVSCWATNGNLDEYLSENSNANRILCLDTAAGVEYLHENDIVHGDLKGVNVLVDSSGRASLGDFGLSSVTDPLILKWTSQSTVASKGGTTRWQAPELLRIENTQTAQNSKESDVFGWAGVCYEIFTQRHPFFETISPMAVMTKITRGDTPSRPNDDDPAWRERGLNVNIWNVMQTCWKFEPLERLDMSEVISKLDKEKPYDPRPPSDWEGRASMCFRNAQDDNNMISKDPLFFCEGLERLLLRVIPGI